MSALTDLPPFGPDGDIQVIVEAPRGSAIKLKYEPRLGAFSVARALPRGLTYPFDWGFVPGTLGPDGDPLDALVMHDTSTYPGVVLPCRVLGVVELSQRGTEGGRQRNDRIIAMPVWHDRLEEFERAADLPARLRKEIELFFLDATFFTNKNAKILGWSSPQKARLLLESGEKRYLKERRAGKSDAVTRL